MVADGKLYLAQGDDMNCKFPVMVRATPEKFEQLGKADLGMFACTSPAIAGGRLYIRRCNDVACYDLTASAATQPGSGPGHGE